MASDAEENYYYALQRQRGASARSRVAENYGRVVGEKIGGQAGQVSGKIAGGATGAVVGAIPGAAVGVLSGGPIGAASGAVKGGQTGFKYGKKAGGVAGKAIGSQAGKRTGDYVGSKMDNLDQRNRLRLQQNQIQEKTERGKGVEAAIRNTTATVAARGALAIPIVGIPLSFVAGRALRNRKVFRGFLLTAFLLALVLGNLLFVPFFLVLYYLS